MGKLLLVAALTLSLAACAQPGGGGGYGMSKQTGGAILGGAGGALAGSQFGKGKGQLAATALGTLLGAFIGSEAGASMDRADQTYYAQQSRGGTYGQPPGYYPPQQRQQWSEPQGYWSAPPRY